MDYNSRRSRRARGSTVFNSHRLRKIFLLSRITTWVFFGLVALVIATPLLFLWYSRDLPAPGKLVYSKYKDATRIYDRNGVLLYSVYQNENRTYVKLSEIPKSLQQGTIAIEDKDFYNNQGFSPIAYLRVIKNLVFGYGLGGGSTISQQLVKNVLLSNERSLQRKVKELILAIQINQVYSKNQILEMYLNNIGYGGANIGVEAAAEAYFGKSVKDLDLAQSVFLSGLPQNPTTYSPFSGHKYYLDRMQAVLTQMVSDHYITNDQSKQAYAEIAHYQFSQHEANLKAPHFVMYVKEQLSKILGSDQAVETGGYQVTTTLDYDIEKQAEETVRKQVAGLKGYQVSNGAAMVTDPKSGEVLAMVGSEDYFDSKNDGNFNVATSNNRQPGSSLKPVMYATALSHGYTAATLIMDTQTVFQASQQDKAYTPVNYDGKFHGPVQLRYALANSLNIPAVKMLAKVGIKPVMQQGYDMGIDSWNPTPQNLSNVGLSLVLGGQETSLYNEMTAYGVFANGGVRKDLLSIIKVTDSKGNVVYEKKDDPGRRVLSQEVSFIISHILSDNSARTMEFGPYSSLVVSGKTVSVKTGTTDEKRDNWTVGYTPNYVVGVWVGNNDNSPMSQTLASGITGAAPIWNAIMTNVLKGKPDQPLQKPDGVTALQIDAFAGGLPHAGQQIRAEYFVKGTEPTSESPIYKSKDGKDYIVIHEDDPVSTDGQNRWQAGIDQWIQQNHKDDPLWNPPDELKTVQPDNTTPTPNGGTSPSPTQTITPTP